MDKINFYKQKDKLNVSIKQYKMYGFAECEIQASGALPFGTLERRIVIFFLFSPILIIQ